MFPGLPTFDLAAIGATLFMSIVGIAIPLGFKDTLWSGPLVEMFSYFTAGVFLGVGMIHMLPEAATAPPCCTSPILAALISPFSLFCVGYILVWAIESSHPASRSKVPKHNILAVATRAHYSSATASVCFVDVPPVTTYHRSAPLDGPTGEGLENGLLQHQAPSAADAVPPAVARSKSAPAPACASKHHDVFTHGEEHGHSHDHEHARGGEGGESGGGGEGAEQAAWCTHEHEGPLHTHEHPGVRHGHFVIGGGGEESHSTLPLLLALLFSVHSMIAGLALGIQPAADASAVAILVAILGHKSIEALR